MIAPPARHGLLPPNFAAEDLPLALRFGGRRCILRFLQPEDAGRLLAFFASHTPETIHQRYGYFFAEMTPEHALRLVDVDQARDAALGVFEGSGDASRLIAVGRICVDDPGCAAEAAFVVHEDRRCLGIASTLLKALLAIAKERNLDALVAQVEHDNAPMLAIFRRAGAAFRGIPGTSSLEVVLKLPRPRPHRAKPRSSWLARTAARTALQLERASVTLHQLPTP